MWEKGWSWFFKYLDGVSPRNPGQHKEKQSRAIARLQNMSDKNIPFGCIFMFELGTERRKVMNIFFTWSSKLLHLCYTIRHTTNRVFYINTCTEMTASRETRKFWYCTVRAVPPTLTLRILLKSSLSTLKKWQLSSRRTMDAALGASFTSANLPKSSPSCRVHTTPCTEQNIYMQKPIITPDSIESPCTNTGLHNQIPKQIYLAGNQQPK